MGYALRRWLADRLPAGLSSGERLVALEIADQANEQTRRAYGRGMLKTVVRRTGYADEKQLGKVLGKLSANGIELRVPVRDKEGRIVVDSRGRTVYACKGHELNFYVPLSEECPVLKVSQEGDQSTPESSAARRTKNAEGPLRSPKGPPPGPQRSPAWSSKVLRSGAPSPQSPQENTSSLLNRAMRQVMTAVGATAEEAREMIEIIRTDNPGIRALPAYLTRMEGNGTLGVLLERVRAGERAVSRVTPTPTPTPPPYAEIHASQAIQAVPVQRDAEPPHRDRSIAAARARLREVTMRAAGPPRPPDVISEPTRAGPHPRGRACTGGWAE
ncbi:hypothetical protein ACFYSC_20340 [Streptosporangium sp. NPDC004379]|uniref:hypothetical protein n=1 Tax=Streptosporangium sp. NPDC004379 TaxID=3366189 RepID=UPI0036802D57